MPLPKLKNYLSVKLAQSSRNLAQSVKLGIDHFAYQYRIKPAFWCSDRALLSLDLG